MEENGRSPEHAKVDEKTHSAINKEMSFKCIANISTSDLKEVDDSFFMTDVHGGQQRLVDFVLVWEDVAESEQSVGEEKRAIFLGKLESEGIKVEHMEPERGQNLRYVKLHTPMEVLKKFAEILKVKKMVEDHSIVHKIK